MHTGLLGTASVMTQNIPVQKIIQISAHWSMILLQDHMQWKESQGTFGTCGCPHHSIPETQPCLAVRWWELQKKSPPDSQKECWGEGASSPPKLWFLWTWRYQKVFPAGTEALKTQAPLPQHTRDARYSPLGLPSWGKVKAMSTISWAVTRELLMALPLNQPSAWWDRRWAVLSGSSAGGVSLPCCSSFYRSNSDPHWLKQSAWDVYTVPKWTHSWPQYSGLRLQNSLGSLSSVLY